MQGAFFRKEANMENADMNGANSNANMVATKTANADMTNTETAEVFKSNPKKSKKGIKKQKCK